MFPLDAKVDIVSHPNEWAAGESSEDEEALEDRAHCADRDDDVKHLDSARHERERFRMRERRLSSGAEVLESVCPIADREVGLVSESKEWAAAEESDQGEVAETQKEDEALEREMLHHHSERFNRRERRLTAGDEVLQQVALPVLDRDVSVVFQRQEWVDAEDSDEDETKVARHQSERFESRVRRLMSGEAALQESGPGADREVVLKSEEADWADGQDSDEEPEKIAEEAFARRERRLMSGAEPLQWGCPRGDKDMDLAHECNDWACADTSDDEAEAGPVKMAKSESERFQLRERRLTTSAQVLEREDAPEGEEAEHDGGGVARRPTDRDVIVVAAREWGAAEEEDAEENEHLNRHHLEAFERRERRLTESLEGLQS